MPVEIQEVTFILKAAQASMEPLLALLLLLRICVLPAHISSLGHISYLCVCMPLR